jgi:O6-methylguanine-DNA--protein-cysteine methyltransferase
MPNQTKELCKVVVDFINGFSAGKDMATFLLEVNSKEGKNIMANLIRPFFPKEKDNLLKKPKTAYAFFMAYAGKKIRKKYPGLDQKNVIEKVRKLWSSISPEKKEKFEEMAKKERDRYEQEKDKGKPRRPPTSFLCFCREKRKQVIEENPKISFGEISVKLGEMWKEEKDKSVWEELAKIPYIEYHEKMKAWKEKQAREKMIAKNIKRNPILAGNF